MAIKTEFSKSELIDILSNYNLGEYKEAKAFAQGTVQTNLLLVTDKGKFAFRYYQNRTREAVSFENKLIILAGEIFIT
jgi:hypothetical protein